MVFWLLWPCHAANSPSWLGLSQGTSGCGLIWSMSAAAAKSLQSCPTLCDPIDGSPPGSPVPGILQARTLEWVAISFSSAWKWSSSVVSNSWRPHGLQLIKLLRPWDFPGKTTGVGCHCLLHGPCLGSFNNVCLCIIEKGTGWLRKFPILFLINIAMNIDLFQSGCWDIPHNIFHLIYVIILGLHSKRRCFHGSCPLNQKNCLLKICIKYKWASL